MDLLKRYHNITNAIKLATTEKPARRDTEQALLDNLHLIPTSALQMALRRAVPHLEQQTKQLRAEIQRIIEP